MFRKLKTNSILLAFYRPFLLNFLRYPPKKIILSSSLVFFFSNSFNRQQLPLNAEEKPKFISESENSGISIYSKQTNTPISSGFILTKKGTFVTILNIFSFEPTSTNIDATSYYAQLWHNSCTYPFVIDYILPEENLAFGHFVKEEKIFGSTAKDLEFQAVELMNSETPQIGNKVYLFSKSTNKLNIIENGYIVDKGQIGIDMMINIKAHDSAIFGSAIMNKQGKVIGMLQPINPNQYDMNLSMIGGKNFKNICEQYIHDKRVRKAYMGLSVKYSHNNLTVIKINSGGPASLAGVKLGDIIQEVNGKTIENMNDFIRNVGYTKNEKVFLKIIRNEKPHIVEINTD